DGLRTACGHGDDADSPGTGPRVGRDHRLLPEEPSDGAPLVEYAGGPADLLHRAGLCYLPDDHTDGLPRRGTGPGQLDHLDQPGGARHRHRRRPLPEEQQPDQIRPDRTADLPGRARRATGGGGTWRGASPKDLTSGYQGEIASRLAPTRQPLSFARPAKAVPLSATVKSERAAVKQPPAALAHDRRQPVTTGSRGRNG